MKKLVIVNVNLQYEFDVDTDEKAIEAVENVELPKEYVEDSFELVKIINELHNYTNFSMLSSQFQKMLDNEIFKKSIYVFFCIFFDLSITLACLSQD